MPRGGKRPNAGRPPALEWLDMIAVGGLCEEYWRNEIKMRLEAKKRQFYEKDTALGDYWRQVATLTEAERKNWLTSQDASEHSKLVDEELGRLGQGRLVSFRVPAPYGKRDAIIERVAGEKGLTLGCVETAWKLYRKEARAGWKP